MVKDKLRRKIIISCCDQQEYEDTYRAIYKQLKGLDCYKEGKVEVMKSKMLKEVIVHISKDCEKIALLHIAKVYKWEVIKYVKIYLYYSNLYFISCSYITCF